MPSASQGLHAMRFAGFRCRHAGNRCVSLSGLGLLFAKLVRHLPPKRVPNRTVRTREYLTPDEVEQLIRAAARVGRHRHRDATLLLVAYRHGLRVGELVSSRNCRAIAKGSTASGSTINTEYVSPGRKAMRSMSRSSTITEA